MTATEPGAALDHATLRSALDHANLPALLGALFHLTGDERWLAPPYRPTRARGPGDHDDAGLAPEVQARLRDEAAAVIAAVVSGDRLPASDPEPAVLARALGITLGEPVPAEEGPLLAEELGLADRRVVLPSRRPATDLQVLVIGGGYSGLCAAIALGRAGIPYEVIEKNPDLGGTWVENVYPGCGVDTPVHLYSFSFAQRPDWPRYFATQPEVRAYLSEVADEHGVRDRTRFDTEVLEAVYDEGAARWEVLVRDADGREERLTANVVISAVGLLNVPATPRIPGLETFAGPTMHTARWRTDVPLAGRRVGVLGTGASAMQLVPAIAGVPEQLVVFQRSPQWAFPNPNLRRTVGCEQQWLMRHVPHYQGWYRLRQLWSFGDRQHPALQIDRDWPHPERAVNAINDRHREFLTAYVRRELADRPDLLERSLPRYPVYGKRPLIDHGWFEALRRDDVTLVTEPIVEVGPESVRTADGSEHELDLLVLATGFQSLRMLGSYGVRGRSGRLLRDVWGEDDARAHLGLTIPGFPNFYCLFGPNTNAGHGGSHVLSVELQVRYVMQMLAAMLEHDVRAFEVRDEVFAAFNERLDAALADTIWTHPGMTTYYRNSRGRIVTNIPWTNAEYWRMTRQPRLADFEAEPGL